MTGLISRPVPGAISRVPAGLGMETTSAGGAFSGESIGAESRGRSPRRGAAAIARLRSPGGTYFARNTNARVVSFQTRYRESLQALLSPIRRPVILEIFSTAYSRAKLAGYAQSSETVEALLSRVGISRELYSHIQNVYANISSTLLLSADDVIDGYEETIIYLEGSAEFANKVVWLENFIKVLEKTPWLKTALSEIVAESRGGNFSSELRLLKRILNAFHVRTDRKD